MIGQENNKKYFKKAIQDNNLNNFYLITGESGSGKSHLIRWISEQSGYFLNIYDNPKVDEVREMTSRSTSLSQPTIMAIENGHNMNRNSQNALLKLMEDTPRNCYIIMEVTDMTRILPTIESRARKVIMEPYSNEEMKEFFGDNVDTRVLKIANNIGLAHEIDMILEIDEMFSFVEMIIANLANVSEANVFNITNRVKITDRDDGEYPLRIIIRMLEVAYGSSKHTNYEIMKVIQEHKTDFSSNSIQKENSMNMMLLKMRSILRGEQNEE